MFTDGEYLHATTKDSAQFITCITIKPNNVIYIKCALGFCYECPECNKPDKELDYGPNASMIHLVYIHIKEDVQHMV